MTDKRWKAVEHGMATAFTKVLSDVGMSPIERIPLLGREGPDLTVNESGLVINVKSRKCIPDRLLAPKNTYLFIGDLVAFRLAEMFPLTDFHDRSAAKMIPWKQLQDWYAHMDKWTKEFQAGGISAIVLHHSKMPYGIATVVIHQNDFWSLQCNLTNLPTK